MLLGPVRVLIVEDNEDVRVIVRGLLGSNGRFAVAGEATDVSEALECARNTRPDVILLDARLPGLDGITALPLLREGIPSARIVVLSGHDELRHSAMSGGAVAFLEKSAALPDLPETLIQILDRAS